MIHGMSSMGYFLRSSLRFVSSLTGGPALSAALIFGALSSASAQANLPATTAAQPAAPAAGVPGSNATGTTGSGAKAPDFAKEAVVFDKLVTRIREEPDGTGTRETTARIRVLADAGVKEFAVLAFTYTATNQQMDIGYVRVIKPDGTVVNTPDYNVQDLPADVTREAPMYSDIHQKHVAVKGLGVGDTLEYNTTLRTLKPEVPGQFWLEYSFEKNNVALDEELDLDVPADKPVTVASADLQPTVTTASGRKLYHWASQNLSRPDPDAPPKSVKKWKPSVQVTTFSSWEQVGAWYQSLQKDQLTVTPAIQAKADALTKGLTTDDEKLHAIFNAVALHIHYVGLEFGIGRYQPHAADDVLSNEYGDCKDKHTLLATLLKAAGVEAWPVLINSGRELDPATPSPGQFDHVITVVPRGDKLLWMDSTEEVAPVGVIMSTLRDKQALAIPANKAAYLEHTPVDLPFPQDVHFDVAGKLDETGQFTGRFTQTYHGDVELLMRTLFRAVPESRWKEFMQRMSASTGFGGEVTAAPEVSPVEKIDDPFQFTYNYTREKYGEWENHRINPPFPAIGWELIPGVKQTKPADDIDIGSPGVQVYTAQVALPTGWHLFPPQGIDLNEDWAEYHSKYSFVNGTFTAERRLVFKKEKVPLADWDKYLRFREAIYGDVSRMSGISGAGIPVPPPFDTRNGGSGTTRVIDLSSQIDLQKMMADLEPLRDAIAVLSASPAPSAADLATASEKCRSQVAEFEAHSHDYEPTDMRALTWPQMLGAGWTCLGWAELEQHNPSAAETHLRAAWNLTQNPLAGYQLARVLEAKGDKNAAKHMYELASVSSPGGLMNNLFPISETSEKISSSYKNLTGKELSVTPLKNGSYNGSLRAELDKSLEVHHLVGIKVSGQAYFALTYEASQPIKAVFIGGDRTIAGARLRLQEKLFPASMPEGSKARLVREVHMICSPWAGCDVYLQLPSAVTLPAQKMKVIEVAPPAASKDARTLGCIDI
jgi:hypothetical protein